MGERDEIPEVNSDGQIDQLESLRFKMKSGKSNLSSSEVGISEMEFRKTKCRRCEWESRKKKRSVNMGTRLGKLKSTPSGNTWLLGEYILREFRMGASIAGRFVYTMGNKPISSGRKRLAPMLVKIEN